MANVRRLAITIKGGVSLGAYEAGALHQTLDLIANNNKKGSTKWYVDVITGASAGSMTAASTAVALIAGDDVNPPNPFHSAWVQAVSVSALMPAGSAHVKENLFDAANLDRIAAQNVKLPFTAPHPHLAFNPAAPLKLAFTLSRLETDPTTVPTLAGKLTYKEYADKARFDLAIKHAAVSVTAYGVAAQADTPAGSEVRDLNAAWRALVQAAIASGSFPIAFQPRCLRRWKNGGWVDFFFVDGGLYDNDPVGEAINLAHDTDWAVKEASDHDRRFLIIHTEPPDLTGPTLHPVASALQNIPVLAALKEIAGDFIKESQTSGLRGIGLVNEQIRQRFEVLNQIALAIPQGAPLAPATAAVEAMAQARGLADKLDNFRAWLIPDLEPARDVPDLDENARAVWEHVNLLPDSQAKSFTELALFYDLSADLIDKVPLKPIVIAPPKDNLSGGPLYGFGGFFDQALRDRDYRQGQFDAYQAWQQVSLAKDSAGRGEFDLTGAQPPPAPPPGDSLKPETLTTYASELAKFRARVKVVLESLSGELVGGHGLLPWIENNVLQSVLGAIGDWAINRGVAAGKAQG